MHLHVNCQLCPHRQVLGYIHCRWSMLGVLGSPRKTLRNSESWSVWWQINLAHTSVQHIHVFIYLPFCLKNVFLCAMPWGQVITPSRVLVGIKTNDIRKEMHSIESGMPWNPFVMAMWTWICNSETWRIVPVVNCSKENGECCLSSPSGSYEESPNENHTGYICERWKRICLWICSRSVRNTLVIVTCMPHIPVAS